MFFKYYWDPDLHLFFMRMTAKKRDKVFFCSMYDIRKQMLGFVINCSVLLENVKRVQNTVRNRPTFPHFTTFCNKSQHLSTERCPPGLGQQSVITSSSETRSRPQWARALSVKFEIIIPRCTIQYFYKEL